ncbi:hypothetical protein [Arabidopsis thaliana]|uniref:Uncharacterized protein AT4g09230 n=1 Tax=Arabidopsis thaliana TaxID=3702 RepID=Q9M0Q6_ARATH|nr:hypothetical protein [Arabidopsis thaliana]
MVIMFLRQISYISLYMFPFAEPLVAEREEESFWSVYELASGKIIHAWIHIDCFFIQLILSPNCMQKLKDYLSSLDMYDPLYLNKLLSTTCLHYLYEVDFYGVFMTERKLWPDSNYGWLGDEVLPFELVVVAVEVVAVVAEVEHFLLVVELLVLVLVLPEEFGSLTLQTFL